MRNVQAEAVMQSIIDENLCAEPEFRQIVQNYRLLKLAPGGKTFFYKDMGVNRIIVAPAVYPTGVETELIELLKTSG